MKHDVKLPSQIKLSYVQELDEYSMGHLISDLASPNNAHIKIDRNALNYLIVNAYYPIQNISDGNLKFIRKRQSI